MSELESIAYHEESLIPLVIGVAGGSGSGKTTVVRKIIESVGENSINLVQHDAYYRDLSHMNAEDRAKQNFDHPASLQTELMVRHVQALKKGFAVEIPKYDFSNHVRKTETWTLRPRKVVLLDGILIFSEKSLLDLMDIKIFVDTDSDIRLLRRLQRDILDRGRTLESVIKQYERYVRPMHLEFVEPSKRHADMIIPRGGQNKIALEMITARINHELSSRELGV
jgi:uridine kinase